MCIEDYRLIFESSSAVSADSAFFELARAFHMCLQVLRAEISEKFASQSHELCNVVNCIRHNSGERFGRPQNCPDIYFPRKFFTGATHAN